jgi:hypothetical protein
VSVRRTAWRRNRVRGSAAVECLSRWSGS